MSNTPEALVLNGPEAFTLEEFCRRVKMGRTRLYEEVRAGRLTIRKNGKRSVVTADEAQRYLNSLPLLDLPAKGEPLSEYAPAAAVAAVRARQAAE